MPGSRRICAQKHPSGEPCGAPPIRGEDFCFWHHPEYADDAAQARRMGGLRSRRESTVAGAYELEGIDTVVGLRRVLEIAILDSLGLDNGIARARTLGYLVGVSLKALELGDLEDRIAVLEQARASDADTPRISADGPTSRFTFVETPR